MKKNDLPDEFSWFTQISVCHPKEITPSVAIALFIISIIIIIIITIWVDIGLLLAGPLRTNFSGISCFAFVFIFKKCVWIYCLENGEQLLSASMC